jgi:hypothetical protein
LCRFQLYHPLYHSRLLTNLRNINVFALAFILSFSITITVLDLILLRFLIYLSKFLAALSPRIDEWIQDGVYQLQRRAYEAHGEGTWKDHNKEIPTTAGGEQLPVLPLGATPVSPSLPAQTHQSSSSLGLSPSPANFDILAIYPKSP